MRQFFATCLLACGLLADVTSANTLAIRHVNLIDATGTPLQPNMTVIVRDGRIADLGPSDTVHVLCNDTFQTRSPRWPSVSLVLSQEGCPSAPVAA